MSGSSQTEADVADNAAHDRRLPAIRLHELDRE